MAMATMTMEDQRKCVRGKKRCLWETTIGYTTNDQRPPLRSPDSSSHTRGNAHLAAAQLTTSDRS
jgi:hypothetical protein